jgi:hypothetical protein
MPTVLPKEELKYVDLNISPEILTLFYLSCITKIDLLTLTLIFEKIGTSLYYLFYMLAKRKISFPSEANLLKAIKFTEVVEALDNNYDHIHKIPEKDKEIFSDLIKHIVDKKYIRVKIDSLSSESSPSPIIKSMNYPGKSELNSSIKKYIRKEKRKLDKIGQMYTLFDKNSSNRASLIDKIYKQFSDKLVESNNETDLKELISILIDGYNN